VRGTTKMPEKVRGAPTIFSSMGKRKKGVLNEGLPQAKLKKNSLGGREQTERLGVLPFIVLETRLEGKGDTKLSISLRGKEVGGKTRKVQGARPQKKVT